MRIHGWKILPFALALAGCGSSTSGARLEGMMDPASLSAARGSPVQVSIAGTPQSTATDASGRFSFGGLAPGERALLGWRGLGDGHGRNWNTFRFPWQRRQVGRSAHGH